MGDRAFVLPPVKDIAISPMWVGPGNLSQAVILVLLGNPVPELGRGEAPVDDNAVCRPVGPALIDKVGKAVHDTCFLQPLLS